MAKGKFGIGRSLNVGAGIFVIVGAIILVIWLAQRLGILAAFRAAAPSLGAAPSGSATPIGGGQFGPSNGDRPPASSGPIGGYIVAPSQPMSAAPSQTTYKSTAPIPGFSPTTREVAFDPRFGLFNTEAINRAAMGPGWVPYNG